MAFSRSIVPAILRPTNDWWDIWDYPSRIFDTNFGFGLTDEDVVLSPFYPRPRRLVSRQTSSRGMSEVSNSTDQFQVSVDVSAFAPNEITVKAVDNNCVVIEAKHEERPDEHGYISRQFTRRYMLPKSALVENIQSSLSPEGILTISVPKKAIEPAKPGEKIIPISMTASPASPMSVDPASPAVQPQQDQCQRQQPATPQEQSAQAQQQPQQTAPVSPAPTTAPAQAPAPEPAK